VAAAFDQFTKALRYDPRHFEAHFNLAHLYFEAGEFRLARLHYDISAVIEPGSAGVHFNLGLIHAINGDLVPAIAALNRAKELAAEDELAQIDELLLGLQNTIQNPK
jgi:Flp pilus assembly protein TadD